MKKTLERYNVLEEVKALVDKHKSNKWLWGFGLFILLGVAIVGFFWLLVKFFGLFKIKWDSKRVRDMYIPKWRSN